jgi:hypothetical protein
MRRLLQLVTGIVVLSGTIGCHCMVGVCDCEPHGCDTVPGFAACGGCGPAGLPQVQPVVAGQPTNTAQPTNQTAPRQLPPPADK